MSLQDPIGEERHPDHYDAETNDFDEDIDAAPDIEEPEILQYCFGDLVDFDLITQQQQWLVYLRLQGCSYNDIIKE